MPRIFISYRRADALDLVRHIGSELERRFGAKNVFIDLRDLPEGSRFPDELIKAIDECTVMLVIIGPQWLSITNAAGVQRLTLPDDWVRLEVLRGLRRPIKVIPVLVHNAQMPTATTLPGDMAELAFREGRRLSDENFDDDLARLVRIIDQRRGRLRVSPARAAWAVGVIILVALLIGILQSPQVHTFLFPPTRPQRQLRQQRSLPLLR